MENGKFTVEFNSDNGGLKSLVLKNDADLAVSSTRTVFSMVYLTFQSPEGMTSACSGRWFMV